MGGNQMNQWLPMVITISNHFYSGIMSKILRFNAFGNIF